eukprot:SAG31_NODE_3318_length_4420_cov_2.018051_2_plen_250_part_00
MVISSSDGRLQSSNMQNVYIRYSPYGTWKLHVTNGASLPLDSVTAVYFEFGLQAKSGDFDGQRLFFTGGSIGELGPEACGDHSAPPPAPPSADGGPSCASYPEFMLLMQSVGSACCGDPSYPCDATGVPTACTESCANELLPMQSVCADFLVRLGTGVRASVDAVAEMCPTTAPNIPCSNFAEFGVASQSVTEACCDDENPCVAGLPTACNRACGEVLPPFYTACQDFLANIGMATNVATALATCGGGH